MQGEGWGTAYEYWVKYVYLLKTTARNQPIKRILIAGLPEKFGLGLDFLIFAQIKQCACVVVDERPEKIAQISKLTEYLVHELFLQEHLFTFVISDIREFTKKALSTEKFDLVLNCEYLQRLSSSVREITIGDILNIAERGIFFVPNKDHEGHKMHSALHALTKEDTNQWKHSIEHMCYYHYRYIDFPPWPAGITLHSGIQRDNLKRKLYITYIVSCMLMIWAVIAENLPEGIRRKKCHMLALICAKG